MNIVEAAKKEYGEKWYEEESLDLEFKRITSLEGISKAAPSLRVLRLKCNEITEIPKEIGLLTRLEWLNLSDNKIKEIPKEIGLLTKLSELDLNYNKITEIPKEIELLTNLYELFLHYNSITDFSVVDKMNIERILK